MKTTKILRTVLILMLAALMLVSAAACSKESSSSSSSDKSAGDTSSTAADADNTAADQGNTETWGNITVAVPDGMTLKGGNALDANDPDAATLTKDDNAFNYYLITVVADEEQAASDIDMTREFNDPVEDVTVSSGVQWTGVTYEYSGTPVFHIYGTVDGRAVEVQSYGFAADSDTTKDLLASLKIAAAE